MSNFLFLQYLLYMHVGNPSFDHTTAHAFVMKSGSDLPFCNRVCNSTPITDDEIEAVRLYFGSTPFRWFVDENDHRTGEQLQAHALSKKISFPAMSIDLKMVQQPADETIFVEEIPLRSFELVKDWLAVVARGYNLPEKEFEIFLNYLVKRGGLAGIRLYGARYNGIMAAVSMAIYHGDTIGLHWVATLPEYRGKGLGYAVSHKPLVDARTNGCSKAVLLASEMGKPIYERIGFVEYARYGVYGL